MTRVLILCTGNSARSQMAEGLLRAMAPELDVQSAGTVPAAQVNPFAVRAMAEIGMDISGARPKSVHQFLPEHFDFVVTVCAEADRDCPAFIGQTGRRVHVGFEDPARAQGSEQEVLAEFRRIRDQIRGRFKRLYEDEIKNEQ
ncbi:MAG TPA: protein tyrosine phosphatase, partial [Solibacterales bacterium]|nr:protein tyrosine phosphatase [Bryobacterales bacterium]